MARRSPAGLHRTRLRRPRVRLNWAKILREGPDGFPGLLHYRLPGNLGVLKSDGSLGSGVSAFLVPTGSLG